MQLRSLDGVTEGHTALPSTVVPVPSQKHMQLLSKEGRTSNCAILLIFEISNLAATANRQPQRANQRRANHPKSFDLHVMPTNGAVIEANSEHKVGEDESRMTWT